MRVLAQRSWNHVYPIALIFLHLFTLHLYGQAVEIEKGVHLKVRLSREISTKTAKKGEEFQAVLAEDCVLEDHVVIPMGSILHGSIVRASRAGRLRGRAELALLFQRVELPSGETFDISASPVAAAEDPLNPAEEGVVRGPSAGKRAAAAVVGAAAAGAAVGAVVDGKRGAAIGTGIGIIAGIIGSAAGGGKDQVLKRGTMLELVLDRPATVPIRGARR